MIFSILLFILGTIFIGYDIVLVIMEPGTFIDFLRSFSHVFSAAGVYMIFAGVYQLKYKRTIFSKIKKIWKLTIVSLILCFFTISVINLSFILTPKKANLNTSGDYLIVLGGGIDKNGNLPDSVICRLEKGCEYLKANPNVLCVVSGGAREWQKYREAPEIKRQLMLRGIEEDRILVEDQALDTIQNFQLSCAMISEHENLSQSEVLSKKWIIVTSDFHLRRSERLADRMGFTDVKGLAAKTPWFKVPVSYLREICSYIKLNLRILLTGKPKAICL